MTIIFTHSRRIAFSVLLLLYLISHQFNVFSSAGPSFHLLEKQNTAASSQVNAPAIAGLYVNNFDQILFNKAKQDSLLNYVKANGYTFLVLYNLAKIHDIASLTTLSTSAELASFISRAKLKYGVQEVAGSAESYDFFRDFIDVYNKTHTNTSERMDVYNFEYEFWNEADTAKSFASYISMLKQIRALAKLRGVKTEVYLGRFNQGQAIRISSNCDRILLHAYVPSDDKAYSYSRQRLIYLGSGSKVVNIIPLFASTTEFMGDWLTTHHISQPYATYLDEFNSDTGAWKQKINITGYHWYKYTTMPQPGCIAPSKPGAISGNISVKPGGSYTYTIPAVNKATSYTWTLPSGWTGSSASNTITVTAGAKGGILSVKANGICGTSTSRQLSISIISCLLPAQPDSIYGNETVTLGSPQRYSITPIADATSYIWTLPDGWTGSSSGTFIAAIAGTNGGTISVKAINSCGIGQETSIPVSIECILPERPEAIAGKSDVMPQSTNVYSIAPVSGATSYTWILPPGWTGLSNTTSIIATAGNAGTLRVRANNICGTGLSSALYITVSPEARISEFQEAENTLQQMEVYPNPTFGEINAYMPMQGDFNVSVCNSVGVEVLNRFIPGTSNIRIDISALQSGLYFLKISSGDQVWYKKVTKN